jgi:hypothetical protein
MGDGAAVQACRLISPSVALGPVPRSRSSASSRIPSVIDTPCLVNPG